MSTGNRPYQGPSWPTKRINDAILELREANGQMRERLTMRFIASMLRPKSGSQITFRYPCEVLAQELRREMDANQAKIAMLEEERERRMREGIWPANGVDGSE